MHACVYYFFFSLSSVFSVSLPSRIKISSFCFTSVWLYILFYDSFSVIFQVTQMVICVPSLSALFTFSVLSYLIHFEIVFVTGRRSGSSFIPLNRKEFRKYRNTFRNTFITICPYPYSVLSVLSSWMTMCVMIYLLVLFHCMSFLCNYQTVLVIIALCRKLWSNKVSLF